jgi:predicted enzyme related to lactoylglutathione lyase
MPDPFDQLRGALIPAQPDPVFAARLRERLARALELPKGVTMTSTTLGTRDPAATPATGPTVITPYLAVRGARNALDWYQQGLGARLRGEPVVMGDGRIGHAEFDIGGAPLFLAEEHPEIGVDAPEPGAGATVTMHVTVPDADAAVSRAVAAGADLERAVADYPYGRLGVIRDPFGHRWMISAPVISGTVISGTGTRPAARHGDLGYVSLWVPDAAQAADFYAAVLGWRYAAYSGAGSRQVEGLTLHHGLWGGVTPPTLFCCFAVDDIAAAAARVQDAGGTAGEPQQEPYGLVSECTDDQGVRFALFQPPGGVSSGPSAARSGLRNGDLAYVTMEVPDSARTRAFYGSVLGWRFSAGSIPDGWQVDDVAPRVGISGGYENATTVPMYRVDDIEAAVAGVRAVGGTATDPEAQPYGITSTCADDQGTRFYLGQLSS